MHQEVLAPHQLALAYEEHLDPGVAPILRQGYHVDVLVGQVKHLLAFVHPLNRLDLVSEHSGPLEFEVLGGLDHSRPDASDHLVRPAFEKQRHLVR